MKEKRKRSMCEGEREKERRGKKEEYEGGEIFFARSGSPVAASAATATTPTASPSSSSFASSSAPNLTAEEVAPSFRAFSIRIQTERLRMRGSTAHDVRRDFASRVEKSEK
jgi:hypothetical protein